MRLHRPLAAGSCIPRITLVLAMTLALAAPVAASTETSYAWFSGGRPVAEAIDAVAVLEAAADQGLDPRDYQAAALRQAFEQAARQLLDASQQARLEAALTAALQRYLADLRQGRIDPRQMQIRFGVPQAQAPAPQDLLHEAMASGRVTQALREAQPQVPMYASLQRALARYRELSGHAAWDTKLALPGRKLSPGDAYADLARLAQRLEILGDLPAGTALPDRYEGALEAAVRSFQERHGLAVDGVIGAATLRELNVTPSERVRQMELALERLRWTPILQAPRMIVVNVPEFVLRAYEVEGSRVKVRLEMKVIVGKALDTRTPLMAEAMRTIEFSPYWNVPSSIAHKETLPRLRRDPGYFHNQGFEFVTASGQVVTTLSDSMLEAVQAGRARIRQRPGPTNALGDIKFVFPNNQAIYLHHTSAPGLFARDRRDFSHGCVRVERPVELAQFALADDPSWTEERIRAAMTAGTSSTVALRQPVPVVIAYSTVLVKGGRVYFHQDLYGHDAQLDRALRARSASLPNLLPPASAAP